MNSADFNDIYENLKGEFLAYSEKVFNNLNTESKLAIAMKYSFFAGGKRVRPVLMLYTAKSLGGDINEVLPYAFALECMHTYSLIHDDLPALDNDDLRRGLPTCHAKYGEATAILAGDALLNLAFEHLLKNCRTERDIKASLELAVSAGAMGMLEGQALDMESEKSAFLGVERLKKIEELKTAKFMTVPFTVPAILYCEEKEESFKSFGSAIGKLFQLADDYKDYCSTSEIIGKTAGKDQKEDKLSAVKIYGVNGLKEKIKSVVNTCIEMIKTLNLGEFLEQFTKRLGMQNEA